MSENPYASIPDRNPYASPPGGGAPRQGDWGGSDEGQFRPAKTSVTAILALVCAAPCCIPGLAQLGGLLGIVAIFRVGTSGGRLKGGVLAGVAVVLSLLGTGIWVALAFGAQIQSRILVAHADVLRDIDTDGGPAGDYALTRQRLEARTGAMVTDERLEDFDRRMDDAFGAFQAPPEANPLLFLSTATPDPVLLAEVERVYPITSFEEAMARSPQPVPVDYANGTVKVVFMVQPQNLDAEQRPKIVDILAIAPDGTPIWLIGPDREQLEATAAPDGDVIPDGAPGGTDATPPGEAESGGEATSGGEASDGG